MQFGSVKCVQARQPVCVTLTSASIWSKFYIGVSLHVLDYVNVTTGFMCLLNTWMCLRGQEHCGFRANTNYIHLKKQSSDIYSFYCCIIEFLPHYSTWNSVLKLPMLAWLARWLWCLSQSSVDDRRAPAARETHTQTEIH